MKICPKCQTENIFDEAQFCKNCGAPLDKSDIAEPLEDMLDNPDEPDFVINETKEPDSPALMQSPGESLNEKKSEESADGFDIASTADILDLGVEDDELKPVEPEPVQPPGAEESSEFADFGLSWEEDAGKSDESTTEEAPTTEEKILATQKELEAIAQSPGSPEKADTGIVGEQNTGESNESSSEEAPTSEEETSATQSKSEAMAQSSENQEKADTGTSWEQNTDKSNESSSAEAPTTEEKTSTAQKESEVKVQSPQLAEKAETGTSRGQNTGKSNETPAEKVPCTENEILAAQNELKSFAQSSKAPDHSENQTEMADVVTPIDDPASQTDQTPLKAQKARGIAYFRKNNIRISGNPFFHEGDEIIVSQKPYVLHPKKLESKYKVGIFSAGVLIVLILIASFFIGSSTPGEGTIIGMILDQNNRPYLEGAVVSIPSLGKRTKTDAQGFFKFELIPAGTYEVEYELGERLVGQGNITVTGGQETLMSFGDISSRSLAQKKSTRKREIKKEPAKTTTSQKSGQTSSISDNKEQSVSGKGNIRLEANVEDARLVLEGQVLGAGNMVYSRITPGIRQITVDKTGYEEYHASIEVKPNETTVINANLKRLKKQLTSKDYLSLGKDALKQKKYNDAIADFNNAIKLSPGLAEAYELRADAYSASGMDELASNDYIKAGEIYRLGNKRDKSIAAFNSALELSPNSTSALIGRAGARSEKGDCSQALEDYEDVLDIDGGNYQAFYGSGVCYFKLSDYKKAEKEFKNAYQIDNSDPILYHYLMLTFLARDKIKDVKRAYAEFKTIASPSELAQFKSSSRFEPILRLIEEDDR